MSMVLSFHFVELAGLVGGQHRRLFIAFPGSCCGTDAGGRLPPSANIITDHSLSRFSVSLQPSLPFPQLTLQHGRE